MKARRSLASGSIGRGLKFKKKAERQLGLDRFAWEKWSPHHRLWLPQNETSITERRTQNPHNETATHLSSLSSRPLIPAFMPPSLSFLTSSLWTSKCQLSCDAFTNSLGHIPHLLHCIHGFLVISLCAQLSHICKLWEGRIQSYSFFLQPQSLAYNMCLIDM